MLLNLLGAFETTFNKSKRRFVRQLSCSYTEVVSPLRKNFRLRSVC